MAKFLSLQHCHKECEISNYHRRMDDDDCDCPDSESWLPEWKLWLKCSILIDVWSNVFHAAVNSPWNPEFVSKSDCFHWHWALSACMLAIIAMVWIIIIKLLNFMSIASILKLYMTLRLLAIMPIILLNYVNIRYGSVPQL